MVKDIVMELPQPDKPRESVCEDCLTKDFEVTDIKGVVSTVTRPECDKVFTHPDDSKVCIAYLRPDRQWKLGCGLASNKFDPEMAAKELSKKKFLNPLKANKRGW